VGETRLGQSVMLYGAFADNVSHAAAVDGGLQEVVALELLFQMEVAHGVPVDAPFRRLGIAL